MPTKAELQKQLNDALLVIEEQNTVLHIADEQINAICNGIQAVSEQQSEIRQTVEELTDRLKNSRPDKPLWLD